MILLVYDSITFLVIYFVILYFSTNCALIEAYILSKHIILTLCLILKWTLSDLPQLKIIFLQVLKSLESRVWTVVIKAINTFRHSKEESVSECAAMAAHCRVAWLDGLLSSLIVVQHLIWDIMCNWESFCASYFVGF